MEYEGQICRAPMERSSYMLPVMVGCTYNRCKFCNLFRHLDYRELPMEQVEKELQRVKGLGGHPKRIFLGDGNAFGLKTGHLLEILRLIKHYFPDFKSVNMDATITSIRLKSDEELKQLYEAGVRHLYIGIESGLDDVLIFMRKDHNKQQAYEEIRRLHQAGMIYDAHIMTGVAGQGRGMENAKAMAKFLIETKPAHVVNFSMFLHEEVELSEDVRAGTFTPASEQESMKEEKELIGLLAASGMEFKYDGFHDYIEVRTKGTLPKDKEKMLQHLEEEIGKWDQEAPVYSYVYGECPVIMKSADHKEIWEMNDKERA